MNILHELNEKQREAVTHKNGPLLVIAGPWDWQNESHHTPYCVSDSRTPGKARECPCDYVYE